MTTAISIFCNSIREWLNFEDYSDELVTSWVRMAESYISTKMRCKHQIEIVNSTVNENKALLPDLWLQIDYVRLINGIPLTFLDRGSFFKNGGPKNTYTITGNYINVGGAIDDGVGIELAFYSAVPALGLMPTWLSLRYPQIITLATLMAAYEYSTDDRAESTGIKVDALISAVNNEHILSKASGSTPVIRSKGLPF